jgi:hypothetical protein
LVNQTDRKAMVQELKGGFQAPWDQTKQGYEAIKKGQIAEGSLDTAAGLGKLIFNAFEAGANNPQATAEFVAENAPQLLVGMAGRAGKALMASGNLGYASENYRKGIENYQAANDGAYPPEATRQEMALAAAGTALAEQAGDMLSLGSMKKLAGQVAKEG